MPASTSAPAGNADVTVVVATRNRRDSLLHTLGRLAELPERPPIVVVDNASSDGTSRAVTERFPDVVVLGAGRNLGAGARTLAAAQVSTPYVAFADDDSWWAPGALRRASTVLDAHPLVAVVAGRVLVGPEATEDPVCARMATSPLGRSVHGVGPDVLGFVACGAVVRRDAFLSVGGFHSRLGVGGEEELLAIDLARRGWRLVYAPDAVAHHHPSAMRDVAGRRRAQLRNGLWVAWLRRPAPRALAATWHVCRRAHRDAAHRGALGDALRGLPWALGARERVPWELERALVKLDE